MTINNIKFKITKNLEEYIRNEKELLDKQYYLIEKLAEIRNQNDLSQRDLSTITGISQPSFARIERNINSPSIITLLKILDPLGYTIDIKRK